MNLTGSSNACLCPLCGTSKLNRCHFNRDIVYCATTVNRACDFKDYRYLGADPSGEYGVYLNDEKRANKEDTLINKGWLNLDNTIIRIDSIEVMTLVESNDGWILFIEMKSGKTLKVVGSSVYPLYHRFNDFAIPETVSIESVSVVVS